MNDNLMLNPCMAGRHYLILISVKLLINVLILHLIHTKDNIMCAIIMCELIKLSIK